MDSMGAYLSLLLRKWFNRTWRTVLRTIYLRMKVREHGSLRSGTALTLKGGYINVRTLPRSRYLPSIGFVRWTHKLLVRGVRTVLRSI